MSEHIPDNFDLFDAHDREQGEKTEKLPTCYECDRPIDDDYCYEINGELICEACLNKNHRKWVDDYMEG